MVSFSEASRQTQKSRQCGEDTIVSKPIVVGFFVFLIITKIN
jgi:hypothetical protein